MSGSKTSTALENNSFAVSFVHLKSRMEYKEDCMKVGESKVRTGLQNCNQGCNKRVAMPSRGVTHDILEVC